MEFASALVPTRVDVNTGGYCVFRVFHEVSIHVQSSTHSLPTVAGA